MTRDPIEYTAGDANLYQYVRSGPVSRVDPSGLEEWGLYWDDSWWDQTPSPAPKAAIAKARQLCANIDYCSEGCKDKGCTRESCVASMTRFVKAVNDTWILGLGYWFGRERYFGWNTCSRWTFDIIDRLPGFGDNDPCIKMAGLQIHHLSATGACRDHVYYKVSMCDGSKINADNGAWGGRDHIFIITQ